MPGDEKRKLEKTITALQNRWGSQIVQRGRPSTAVSAISTTFPELDAALGSGGIPRGRLTEIGGVPTSGMATLVLKVIAAAQGEGGTAVYLDIERTFDADYAARCGVQLQQLIVVRPYTVRQGLHMLADFLAPGSPDVLVFDSALERLTEPVTADLLTTAVSRLTSPLAHSACALIFLLALPEPPPPSPLAHYAALRLRLHKERWLYHRGDVRGYEAQVEVTRSRLGPAGRRARIAITFNGVVDGDGVSSRARRR